MAGERFTGYMGTCNASNGQTWTDPKRKMSLLDLTGYPSAGLFWMWRPIKYTGRIMTRPRELTGPSGTIGQGYDGQISTAPACGMLLAAFNTFTLVAALDPVNHKLYWPLLPHRDPSTGDIPIPAHITDKPGRIPGRNLRPGEQRASTGPGCRLQIIRCRLISEQTKFFWPNAYESTERRSCRLPDRTPKTLRNK